MKTCCRCKVSKSLEYFGWKNKLAETYQPFCKECKKEYNKKWYANETNRRNQIARASKNNKAYLSRMIQWKIEYVSANGGCSESECDVVNPIMIDFDHIDREEKSFNISEMFKRGYSIEAIEEEVSKCRLLCANHHRVRTAEQMGWSMHTSVSPLPPKELKA